MKPGTVKERLNESVDRETIACERMEKIEDRLMENEEGKGQDKVLDRMEKIEEKINKKSEDKLATMSKDKDKEKELEDRVKDNEERMESLRKAGDGTRKKEFMREMKDKYVEATGKKRKYFGVDLGTGSRERRELVNRTIRCLQDSVAHKDKERFRTVFGRTRISLLGKEMEEKQYCIGAGQSTLCQFCWSVGRRRTRGYWRRFFRRQAGIPLLSGLRSAWSS